MQIRPAQPGDARRIAEIHVRAWQSAYRGIMPDSVLDALSVDRREQFWAGELAELGRVTLVADEAGRIVGWVGFGACRDSDAPEAAEVYGIYLDPAFCRRGIGRLLLSGAIERLAAVGYARLAVWVLSANAPARRFYEALCGELDQTAAKSFEREGVALPEVRYWFSILPKRP